MILALKEIEDVGVKGNDCQWRNWGVEGSKTDPLSGCEVN
jgi:hypothetical protein